MTELERLKLAFVKSNGTLERSSITALIIKAMAEQQAEIDELRKQLADLARYRADGHQFSRTRHIR